MRDASDVPELLEYDPALFVNGFADFKPASNLLRRIDTWRPGVPLPLLRDLRRLGDDQTGARALSIVLHIQIGGHITWLPGTRTGQGRHCNTMTQRPARYFYRRKKVGVHNFVFRFKDSTFENLNLTSQQSTL
jgi:hypothetical protein